MALAQDEAVALRPVGVFCIVAKDPAKVEGGRDFDARKRTGRVARAGGGRAGDDVLANGPGAGLELRQRGRLSGYGHETNLRGPVGDSLPRYSVVL